MLIVEIFESPGATNAARDRMATLEIHAIKGGNDFAADFDVVMFDKHGQEAGRSEVRGFSRADGLVALVAAAATEVK